MKTSIPNEVMGNEKKKTCLHEFERHDGIGNTNKVVLYSPFFFLIVLAPTLIQNAARHAPTVDTK